MEINFFSKKNTFLKQRNRGQAMIVSVIYFLFISLSVVFGVISPSVREYKIASIDLNSKKAYYLGESGVEDSIYRLKTGKNVFAIGETTATKNLTLDGVLAVTEIERNTDGSQIEINATGSVSKGYTSKYERKIYSKLEIGEGVDFNYGVHVGAGGVVLNKGIINGNVFSNGPIISLEGGKEDSITGSAISSDHEELIDFNNTAKDTEINFGTREVQSIAQGFTASKDFTLGKISFCLNKNFDGDANGIIISIYDDEDGNFGNDKKTISSVEEIIQGESCNWIEAEVVNADGIINFIEGRKYWIVLEVSNPNEEKYFSIAQNKNIYTGNDSKTYDGFSWKPGEDVDYFFEIYEVTKGKIEGQNEKLSIGDNEGDVIKAHEVKKVSTTNGKKYCNIPLLEYCDDTIDSIQSENYLLDDVLISGWKNEAQEAAKSNNSNNYSENSLSVPNNENVTFGPGIINGDLSFKGSGKFLFNSPVWIKGKISMNSASSEIKVNNNSSGVILVDGSVSVIKNGIIGEGDNYVMIASLSGYNDGVCDGSAYTIPSLEIDGASGSSVLYSPCSAISVEGNKAIVNAVLGYSLSVNNGATIDYDSGLIDVNFTNGPSGGYNISSWKEE